MNSLYERIEGLCRLEGVSVTEMCRQSGVSRGAISDLKAGRKSGLSADTLKKLALYFGVSADHLLGVAPGDALLKIREIPPADRLLRDYFEQKAGRPPSRKELEELERYIGIFLKSLGR